MGKLISLSSTEEGKLKEKSRTLFRLKIRKKSTSREPEEYISKEEKREIYNRKTEIERRKAIIVEDRQAAKRLVNMHKTSKLDRIYRDFIEWGIIAVIVFSPLPAASVYEWSILVIQVIVFMMLIAYFLMKSKPEANHALSRSIKWPFYLFAALFILIFMQILPLPNLLVKLISPNSFSFRETFSPEYLDSGFMGLSLIPSYSFREALELLTYFLLGFLIIKTVTEKTQVLRIFYVVIGMGIFQAFYGLFELYDKNPEILFYKKRFYLDSVTGSFVNRNHFAGYLEMVIPITIGLILSRIDFTSLSGQKWKDKILSLATKDVYRNLLLSLSVILMAMAIVFSKSRSGISLVIIGFILFIGLGILYLGEFPKRLSNIKAYIQIIVVGIVLISLLVGIDATIERFSLEEVLAEQRPVFWNQTFQIVEDFPLFGSGLGTFASMYPAYDETDISAHLSHAHNDYLEYLSELGFIGMALLVGGIGLTFIRSFTNWKKSKNLEIKGLTIGAIIAGFLLLLHSITDFNLHIPANMLLFAVVLSLMMVLSSLNATETEVREKKQSSIYKRILWAGLCIMLIGVVALMYWNQHKYYKAEKLEDNLEKIGILERTNQYYPFNPLVHYELGKAYYDYGLEHVQDNETRTSAFENSILAFNSSLKLNPISSFSHFYLGQVLYHNSYFSPQYGIQAEAQFRKAAMLAGHNRQIYFELSKHYLSRWIELGEEEKEFAADILDKTIKTADKEQLLTIMQFWELNSKDYSLVESILPRNVNAYRLYANFLGEKSLSIEKRKQYLAEVEAMEYERAWKEFSSGENAFLYYRFRSASQHYTRCLDILKRIRFYQNLLGDELFEFEDFKRIQKVSNLKLIKCYLRLGKAFGDVENLLYSYLELEDSKAALSDFHTYLKDQRFIKKNLELDFEAFDSMYFHIYLYFKLNRFGEITRLGNLLNTSLVIVPDQQKKVYAKTLKLLGNTCLSLDDIYSAVEFFEKAQEINQDDLETLFYIRKGYEQLNDDLKIREIDEDIDRLLAPQEIRYNNNQIRKGKIYAEKMNLRGGITTFGISFLDNNEQPWPLISVLHNERVIWEDYVDADVLTITLDSFQGDNIIKIIPLNKSVTLSSIVRY